MPADVFCTQESLCSSMHAGVWIAHLQLGHGHELEAHEFIGPEARLVHGEQGQVADDALAQHARAPLLRVARPPHVHRRCVHDLRARARLVWCSPPCCCLRREPCSHLQHVGCDTRPVDGTVSRTHTCKRLPLGDEDSISTSQPGLSRVNREVMCPTWFSLTGKRHARC